MYAYFGGIERQGFGATLVKYHNNSVNKQEMLQNALYTREINRLILGVRTC